MTPALNLVIPPRMGLWPSGAVHENDEGAAFCCEESGASGQGAVRSGDGGGEGSTDAGDGNRWHCLGWSLMHRRDADLRG
jgi:hypothetical protein